MLNKCILVLIFLLPGLSIAGHMVTGEIKYIGVNVLNIPDGAAIGTGVVFESSCRLGGDPSVNYMVIDFTRPGMKEAYSLALAAQISGEIVTFIGSSECIGNYEILKSISINK